MSALVSPAVAQTPAVEIAVSADDEGTDPPVLSGDETPEELGLTGEEPLLPPAPADTEPSETLAALAVNCKDKSQATIAKTYYRGPGKVYLRCGNKDWGYRHLVARGRWSATFDKKISRTIWSGIITRDMPGERIYEDVRIQCPPTAFKVVTNPRYYGKNPKIDPQGIITAYKPNKLAEEETLC
ncbi:hypothetical protein ACMA1D_17070 [Streptomyces sp. 796.1]|uniref:hypothetical protein n=1 Tax=Streptomyces sp. 796.1 TaxID=3163029 RepID=UPI0039C90345